MSSRKISLSGWRPIAVVSESRKNLLPALGPALDDQHPAATLELLRRDVDLFLEIRLELAGHEGDRRVGSSPPATATPQDEQKFAPSGFLWPQFVQYMAANLYRYFRVSQAGAPPGQRRLRYSVSFP